MWDVVPWNCCLKPGVVGTRRVQRLPSSCAHLSLAPIPPRSLFCGLLFLSSSFLPSLLDAMAANSHATTRRDPSTTGASHIGAGTRSDGACGRGGYRAMADGLLGLSVTPDPTPPLRSGLIPALPPVNSTGRVSEHVGCVMGDTFGYKPKERSSATIGTSGCGSSWRARMGPVANIQIWSPFDVHDLESRLGFLELQLSRQSLLFLFI